MSYNCRPLVQPWSLWQSRLWPSWDVWLQRRGKRHGLDNKHKVKRPRRDAASRFGGSAQREPLSSRWQFVENVQENLPPFMRWPSASASVVIDFKSTKTREGPQLGARPEKLPSLSPFPALLSLPRPKKMTTCARSHRSAERGSSQSSFHGQP